MSSTATPFYLDWTFWAAGFVAVLALVLSQLPPVKILLRRTKLAVRPYDRLNATHWLGNANVNLHILLTNVGGRTIKVSLSDWILHAMTGSPVRCRRRPFRGRTEHLVFLLFTQITLEPDKEWGNFVSFLAPFSDADERLSKQLTRDLRLEIDAKVAAQSVAEGPKQLVESAAAQVAPLLGFFQQHNFWRAGEYRVVLSATCEPQRASITKTFRFTLFESDVQKLEATRSNMDSASISPIHRSPRSTHASRTLPSAA